PSMIHKPDGVFGRDSLISVVSCFFVDRFCHITKRDPRITQTNMKPNTQKVIILIKIHRGLS
ncbi:MAG: hypothetical protein ACRD6N_12575, partial [Pyrinomonadaceae bacterium]